MHQWFLRRLELAPDGPAIHADSGSLTYAEVHEKASRWAAALPPGDRVAVSSRDRTTGHLGMLAALYAGATAVPLNARWPDRRKEQVLASALVDVLITDADQVDSDAGPRRFGPSEQRKAEGSRHGYVASASQGDAPAYIIHTSGSTGEPKGVPIGHDNVGAFLRAALERFDVGPGDVFSQVSDISFDFLALLHRRDPDNAYDNRAYRERTGVDSRIATSELGDLVARGLIQQTGTRRWARYQLTTATTENPATRADRRASIIDGSRRGNPFSRSTRRQNRPQRQGRAQLARRPPQGGSHRNRRQPPKPKRPLPNPQSSTPIPRRTHCRSRGRVGRRRRGCSRVS